jgi:hypothetical protein
MMGRRAEGVTVVAPHGVAGAVELGVTAAAGVADTVA